MVHYYSIFIVVVLVLLTIFAYMWTNDDTTPEMDVDVDVAVERSGDAPKKCGKACYSNIAPVCGYDSETGTSKEYVNECAFSIAQCKNPNLKLLNKGKCPAQCENPNLKLLNKGKCPKEGAVGKVGAAVVRPKDKCYKGCPKLHAPVCGYDSENGTSKSYSNGCEFSNAQCENPNLKKLNTGLCPGESIVYV